MKHLIYALFLYLCIFSIYADPLYLEHVNQATEHDDQKLQEAHKQIKEHTETSLKENLFVSPFHKQNPKKPTDKKAFCHTCHQKQPHSKNDRKRSFLNMHTRYISCETCHFTPKNAQLEYRWLNFNNDNNKTEAKRITPFYNDKAVTIFSDHELATKSKNTWNKTAGDKPSLAALDKEKAKLKLRLHTPLNKEGPKCLDCHNKKEQLLDLKSLGFSEKEISKLQQHSIPRFFSRFTKEEQRLRMSDLLQ